MRIRTSTSPLLHQWLLTDTAQLRTHRSLPEIAWSADADGLITGKVRGTDHIAVDAGVRLWAEILDLEQVACPAGLTYAAQHGPFTIEVHGIVSCGEPVYDEQVVKLVAAVLSGPLASKTAELAQLRELVRTDLALTWLLEEIETLDHQLGACQGCIPELDSTCADHTMQPASAAKTAALHSINASS